MFIWFHFKAVLITVCNLYGGSLVLREGYCYCVFSLLCTVESSLCSSVTLSTVVMTDLCETISIVKTHFTGWFTFISRALLTLKRMCSHAVKTNLPLRMFHIDGKQMYICSVFGDQKWGEYLQGLQADWRNVTALYINLCSYSIYECKKYVQSIHHQLVKFVGDNVMSWQNVAKLVSEESL